MPIYRKGQKEDLGNSRRKQPQVLLGRFRLDRKENLTPRMVRHWNKPRLHIQTVISAQKSLEGFKGCVDVALGDRV